MVFFNLRGVVGTGTITLGDLGAITWASTTTAYNLLSDTGLSRISAGIVGVGNGTQGDVSGTIQANLFGGGLTSKVIIGSATGAFATPDYAFNGTNGSKSGMFFQNGNGLGFSYLGNAEFLVYSGYVSIPDANVYAWNASPIMTGNPDTGISRLGAASLAIGNGTAGNTTGNLSYNRINTAGGDHAGQVTVTAGNTTQAKAFAANYTGTGQPVIVLTPTSDPLALGVPVGYWVTYSGGAGAWTGWVLNIQTALAGNIVFNYVVIGVA
jgi:hypothetical protein